jgi:hypothetical protein
MSVTFAVSRRPPVDLPLVRSARALVVGTGRGCGCSSGDSVARVMAEIGMTHAAAMHADPNRDWTPRDWITHVAEEHEILFPALLVAGKGDPTVAKIVARLEADHAVYLERLSAGLELPRGSEPYSIDVHGDVEDGLVKEYASALRSGPRVGTMIMKSSSTTAMDTVKSPTHASPSLWPWAVGGVLGAGAWLVGLGPLGIALSAAGGAGGTYVVQKAKTPAPAGPQLLYAPTPAAFVDPETYFRQVAQQAADVHAMLNARQDESDARVKKWKEAAKNIPVIGDFSGALIDLGAWFGKILGSNYSEENSPEDVQHAADGISKWLQVGLVPPVPLFTAKDGANSYGREMDLGLELLREGADKSEVDNLSARALKTMATLTILDAGCPAMKRAIADAGSGNGSLRGVGWYGTPPKLVGFESIAAGVASCEFGVPYDAAFAYARKVTDHAGDYPIRAGLATNHFANAFTETMRAASAGEIK